MRYIAFLAALAAALTLAPPAAAADDWAWPVRGDVITPYKNGDDPYAAGQHRGIDIAAGVGTRVSAATGGRVSFAGVAGGSGLTVNVRTADGSYDVSYLHLSAVTTHEGDTVGRGDPIGAVGTSGTRSVEQPHLHLGVREAGDRHAYRDPLDFLPPLGPPAIERPPAAPAEATDPALAPPAAAPALSKEQAELTTEALVPLPSGVPVGVLAGQGGAGAPAAQVGPRADTGAAHGSPASGHGASGTQAAPAGHESAPSTNGSGAAGRGAAGTHVSPAAGDAPLAHSSEAGPGIRRAASTPRRHSAHGSRGPSRHAVTPRGRAITRADLGSPSPLRETARRATPAPQLHLAAPDREAAPNRPAGPGLDIGWLAAVLGLVTVATCLGRPRQARRAARTGRTALGAVLRPLAGRG